MDIKVGDVVKIKPEWCDGEIDKKSFWVVLEFYENTNRFLIGLVDAKRNGFPLGLTQLVSYDMVKAV